MASLTRWMWVWVNSGSYSWGHKESDTTERLNWTEVYDSAGGTRRKQELWYLETREMLIQFHPRHFAAEETSWWRGKTKRHRLGIFPDFQCQSPLVTQGGRRVKAGREVALTKAAWNRFSIESAEVGKSPMNGEGVWKDFWGRVWALDQGLRAARHRGGREGFVLKGQ